ncbi:MAG TPA: hypothetical protein VGL99_34540 [Chloroflexota bacterium]
MEPLEQAERDQVIALRSEAERCRKLAKVSARFKLQFVLRASLHGQFDVALRDQRRRGRDIQSRRISAYACPGIALEGGLLRMRIRDPQPDSVKPAHACRPERIQPGQRARRHEYPASSSSAHCDEPFPETSVSEAGPARRDQCCA